MTGISQDGKVEPVTRALEAAGLSLDPLSVVASDETPSHLAPHRLEPTGLLGEGGMGTGTGVPGITGGPGSMPGGYQTDFIVGEGVLDRLSDLEIPDDELENYIEAVDEGRSVVAYFAKAGDVERVEKLFRDAGLAKVKTF